MKQPRTSLLALAAAVASLPGVAAGIEPYRAATIEPYQAQEVQPYRAPQPEQYRPRPLHPQAPRPVEPAAPATAPKPATQEPSREGQGEHGKKNQEPVPSALFGVWRTSVPGAVWESPSGIDGYNRLNVSPGAQAGDLTISPNGTYRWNSYGGKSGKWKRGSGEYPIILIDTVEKREWQVGFDGRSKEILIWDGSIWYRGRK